MFSLDGFALLLSSGSGSEMGSFLVLSLGVGSVFSLEGFAASGVSMGSLPVSSDELNGFSQDVAQY